MNPHLTRVLIPSLPSLGSRGGKPGSHAPCQIRDLLGVDTVGGEQSLNNWVGQRVADAAGEPWVSGGDIAVAGMHRKLLVQGLETGRLATHMDGTDRSHP